MFKNKKVAVIADLHLGLSQNSTIWHQIALDWSDWFVSELHKNDITDIIFCGDWFDARDLIGVNTMHVASLIKDKLSAFSIHALTGNHCCYFKDHSKVNSLTVFKSDNFHVYEQTKTIESHGQKITFIPWGEGNIPNSDIIFGHFEIAQFKMNNYTICERGLSVFDLLKKAPLVMSGHFHLKDEKKTSKGTIMYVGNPFHMDFSDADSKKGFYILDIVTKEYEFIENTVSPKHHVIKLSELIDIKDFTELYDQINGNFVKFIIDRHINNADYDWLITKFGSYKPLNIITDRLCHITSFDSSKNIQTTAEVDIEQSISEFVSILDINNKPELLLYLKDLYYANR